MVSHWTYCSAGEHDDLHQGDIICRDDRVVEILNDAHKYFCSERYIAFLVVTQTCDLVRRKGRPCKANYISLAVVRELVHVLPDMVQELSGSSYKSILIRERKRDAEEFLERLINQNEQARGLFYLHPAADAGVATASVAFLRITIALRRDHYDVLTKCRVGRLEAEFSNKLGWLVGNLYSRIGTPDWNEKAETGVGQALAKDYLNDAAPEDRWVPEACIDEAKRKGVDFASLEGQFATKLLQYSPPSALEVFIRELHATAVAIRFDAIKDQMKATMKDDPILRNLIVCDVTSRFSDTNESLKALIEAALRQSERFATEVVNSISSIVKGADKIEGSDSFKGAIDAARETNTATPPVIRVVEETLAASIGKQLENVSARLSGAPFFRTATFDHISIILDSFGNEEHSLALKKLEGRLRNNSRLKSLSKIGSSQR
jgi:hypothetical protein